MDGCHEVQLHLHNADGYPIQLYEQTDSQQCYVIRVQHMSQANKDDIISLKILQGHDCITTAAETSTQIFTKSDFFMYSTTVRNFPDLIFCITLHEKTEEFPLVSKGYVSAAQMKKSIGQLSITLVNNLVIPVGHIEVNYMVIKPWEAPLTTNDDIQAPADEREGAYLCGHRGAGSSFDTHLKPSPYPENTIAAFQAAKSLGFDFIEFDVHVSRDHIPVVFHDDTVKVSVETSQHAVEFEVAVKDLTFEQARQVKVWKWSDEIANQINGAKLQQSEISKNGVVGHQDNRMFPSLEQVFTDVPLEVGFLLEVKYPMETLESGKVDHLCTDANVLVDSILKVVFENTRSRRIYLMCFDPNICAMLKQKQSKYPVLFLSACENDFWTPYKDMRTRTLNDAVAFARSHDLDGVSVFSTPLLSNPEMIDKVKQAKLVLSTWGDENCEVAKRKWQEERGVQYITVDRL